MLFSVSLGSPPRPQPSATPGGCRPLRGPRPGESARRGRRRRRPRPRAPTTGVVASGRGDVVGDPPCPCRCRGPARSPPAGRGRRARGRPRSCIPCSAGPGRGAAAARGRPAGHPGPEARGEVRRGCARHPLPVGGRCGRGPRPFTPRAPEAIGRRRRRRKWMRPAAAGGRLGGDLARPGGRRCRGRRRRSGSGWPGAASRRPMERGGPGR